MRYGKERNGRTVARRAEKRARQTTTTRPCVFYLAAPFESRVARRRMNPPTARGFPRRLSSATWWRWWW